MVKHSVFRIATAWLLLLCMFIGLMPGTAFATPESVAATTETRSADAAATVEELRSSLSSVTAPTGALRYGNELVDLTGYKTFSGDGTSIHTALDFLKGRYYLAAKVGTKYYLFDGSKEPTNGVIKAYERTRSGNSLTTTTKGNSIIFNFKSTNNNKDSDYSIRLGQGSFLTKADADQIIKLTSSEPSHTAWVWSTDEQRIVINDYTSKKRYSMTLSSDKATYNWALCTDADAHGAGTDYTRFYLFRYCYRLDTLHSAIQTMASYLDRPAGSSDEMFRSFLECYQATIAMYNQYNTELTEELYLKAEYIQTQVDAMRNELLSYQKLLDASLSYLDIPIEVLDFRADGFLFESPKTFNTPCTLSKGSPDLTLPDGSTLSRPGKQEWGENHVEGDALNFYIEGLTEKHLVNGSIVYTPEVITYIANSLLYYTESIPNASNYNANWNGNILAKTNESDFTLGSWEQTLAKIKYTNGNHLSWSEVETAFDLAYYMLLYVWQPTKAGDVMEENAAVNSGNMDLSYNMEVPELQYLRLYYNSSKESYSFASGSSYSRSAGYIFNDGQSKISGNPGFNVVHNLGFEQADVFNVGTTGTNTTTKNITKYKADSNFFYSLHASSKFVYYKEKNYYFKFQGDDDVYFFMNDTLICDIGGIHGSPIRTVYLEEKMEDSDQTYAEYLGLKDGDICSFDMFFADRHLEGINLTFETNIQLLNEDVITEKHQYQLQSEGQNTVDGTTGMGTYLQDNAIVNIGDTVAYSFDLLNKGDVPVNQVSFRDETLGTELSESAIILSNTELTNGVTTNYGDLKLFYGPYSAKAGATLTGPGEAITFQALEGLLQEMNRTVTVDGNLTYPTFPDKVYCFTPSGSVTYTDSTTGKTKTLSEAQQIQVLLELGVAANGHLKVYGISRNTGSEDMPYRNVLRSVCYDRVNGNVKIEGIARRSVRVPDISSDLRPAAEARTVVIDYGKAVEIPYGSVEEGFFTAPSQSVTAFLGITSSGRNSDLLRTLPTDLACKAVGKTMTSTNGIYTRTNSGLLFAPGRMLSQAERVYGVFSLAGCYGPGVNGTSVEYKYILQEIRILPATVMYYETDFAPNVFTLTQKGGGDPWKSTADGSTASDGEQDYSLMAGTIYDQVVDRENVPSKAFFVDFDNTGNVRRYREQLQYKGYDFDKATAWYSHHNTNIIYNDHAQNASAGTMELTNITSHDENGNKLGAWIQTMVPGGTIGSRAIGLVSGQRHFAQVRFRVENCVSYAKSGNISLFFSNTSDTEIQGDVATEDRRARLSLDNEEVLSGNYLTVRIPLDGTYYANSMSIDIIRLYIAGYTDDGSGKGKISIDYIYVGPELGISEDVYDDYLFFDFTNTQADALRYSSTVYGGNNFDLANSDGSATHWAGRDTGFTKGTAQISNGTLIVKPKQNTFASIYADTQSGNSNATTHLLNYDASNAEVFQMRFKVTGITDDNATARATIHFYYESGSVSNPYDKHDESDPANFDSTYLSNGEYITVQGSIPQAVRDRRYYDRLIMWVGGFPESGSSQNAVLTFDYIYIGPKDRLDEINAAQSTQDKMNLELPTEDHLFFDFMNDDRSKTRYATPVYGAKNFGLKSSWTASAGYVDITSVGEGTIVLDDHTDLSNGTEGANGNIFCSAYPLNYKVGQQDYCRVRLKIDNAVPDGNASRALGIRADFRDSKDVQNSSKTIPIDWSKVNNGYFTVDIPLDTTGYRNIDTLRRFNVVVIGTQCATVTIDYIYVGALTDAIPASQSLYFSFDDTQSDRLRYSSDTYGYSNFDSKDWILGSANSTKTFDSYPVNWTATNGTLSFNTQSGNLEATIPSGSTSFTLQTGATGKKLLNYHPTGRDVAQIRLKTENLTINNNFSVTLQYLAGGTSSYSAAETFVLAPMYDLSPDKDYVIFNLKPGEAFAKAPNIQSIRIKISGIATTGSGSDRILIDYIYVGVGDVAPMPVYGYDSSYANDSYHSNGSSYTVEGQGVKLAANTSNYTEASFDFVGTGFDIIARTGKDQATIRVEVAEKATGTVHKTMTVNNKGEMELYQIPVVSIQGLPHGEYTVTLWVNKAVASDYEFLKRGGTFCFDAVRIYDPIATEQKEALSLTEQQAMKAYVNDGEAYPYTKEIRDSLLTLAQYNQGSYTEGALFVDSNVEYPKPDFEPSGENTHLALTVLDYNKLGPKNEVYLSPGEAVAFKLELDTVEKPVSIDVGAKSILGDEAVLAAGFVTSINGTVESMTVNSKKVASVKTGTALYYALDGSNLPTSTDAYVILYNAHTGTDATKNILSVTDMKITYPQAPTADLNEDDNTQDGSGEILPMAEPGKGSLKTGATEKPYRFTVDGNTVTAAELFLNSFYETPADDPVNVDSAVAIRHSLNLASDISINYMVAVADLEGYTGIRMEITVPPSEDDTEATGTIVALEPVVKNGYYYFTMDGITAVRMTEELSATVYMEKAGQLYCSETDIYSVAQYAYAQLGKAGASPALKTLCADLLRYGTKAQLFKSYALDSLADSAMTDAHKAYLSDMDSVTFGNTNAVSEDLPNAPIRWVGKALDLASKVTVRFVFDLGAYEVKVDALSLRISYMDLSGKVKESVITEVEAYDLQKGRYAFSFDGLMAAELRAVTAVQIYHGDTPVSCTLQYAADTYGNGKTGTLGDLCKALFAYSDSAKQYFLS